MNNVSFKANLIVHENLYKKLPEGTPEGYTDNLLEDYRKFLDHRVIKAVTEGDTIELFKDKNRGNFAIGIKYTSDKLPEPIESGIYTNKKLPTVRPSSLIHDTMVYLVIKSGIKQRYSESIKQSFLRAVTSMLEENKKEQ